MIQFLCALGDPYLWVESSSAFLGGSADIFAKEARFCCWAELEVLDAEPLASIEAPLTVEVAMLAKRSNRNAPPAPRMSTEMLSIRERQVDEALGAGGVETFATTSLKTCSEGDQSHCRL